MTAESSRRSAPNTVGTMGAAAGTAGCSESGGGGGNAMALAGSYTTAAMETLAPEFLVVRVGSRPSVLTILRRRKPDSYKLTDGELLETSPPTRASCA